MQKTPSIKLIACDIDGTLLREGRTSIPLEILEVVQKLLEKGYLFATCSGRQYTNLHRLFSVIKDSKTDKPLAESIFFIAENGALVMDKGQPSTAKILHKHAIEDKYVKELGEELIQHPESICILSGIYTSYIKSERNELYDQITGQWGIDVKDFNRLDEIHEPILKISGFIFNGNAHEVEKDFIVKWSRHLNIAISGDKWLDFTLANKGEGLQKLASHLGITSDEIMAFGDNFNDVAMLEYAGHPYLMEDAHVDLKKRFPQHCKEVIDVLKTLL